MQKTKIEWVKGPDGSQGYSWNPVQGVCLKKCALPDGRIYCYSHRNYQRFKRNPEIRYEGLNEPFYLKKPSTIFVCSTFEIFHPIIVDWVRDDIFRIIEGLERHTFIVLTKLPENIDRSMPDNVWLGVSVTKQEDLWRIESLREASAKIKFISFEPLLEKILLVNKEKYLIDLNFINWIILGKLNGFGKKYDPTPLWIGSIKYYADQFDIPIFMKKELKDIWARELIQKFPRVK